tara:strand:- start:1457 stop:3073 length:1617 start_codon:yes stop_codon:yes gene_type:complete
MATAYDFSNFTADDLLEAELAEEERVARAQARADASAAKLNAFQALMGQSQTARANVISSDSDAASLKAYSQGKDVEHLSHIRQRMATAMEKGELSLNDIKKFNIWYGEQNFPYRFEEDIRTAYNNMSAQIVAQKAETHAATVTRPAAELTFKTAQTEADYVTDEPKRQAIIRDITHATHLDAASAVSLLRNRLVAANTKPADVDKAVENLEEYIKLRQSVKEGRLNQTVGAIASGIFSKLIGGEYGPDEIQWVDAIADYDEQMSKYPGISTEQYNEGRKKIDDLITKMKEEKAAKISEAAEQHRIAVTRPGAVLDLESKQRAERKVSGIDVKNITAARVAIYEQYKGSKSMGDWYLARQALQDAFDKARAGGAVFEAGQVDQQFEELERSLPHLKPIQYTGDIKELQQLTALASPIGKTPEQAAIARGQAIEAVKMGIRKDPITSQIPWFQNNLNTYAEGIVDALIALQTGVPINTTFYDSDANTITLDTISTWPYALGKSKDTAIHVNQMPTDEEKRILRTNGIKYLMFAGEGYTL